MTQSKHTPKMTRVEHDNHSVWKLTDGISTGYGNDPEGAKAAFDEDKAFNQSLYESEANAHLIAAAPEMLGALILAQDELRFRTSGESETYMETLEAIETAIAKAKADEIWQIVKDMKDD